MGGLELAARLAAGSILVATVGAASVGAAGGSGAWPELRRRAGAPTGDLLLRLTLAWITGIALLVPVLLLAGLAGVPLTAWTVAATALLLAAGLWAARAAAGRPAGEVTPEPLPPPTLPPWTASRLLTIASRLVLAAALAVAAAKLAAMPLWSWDHYAIWGVKAERLVAGGRLDLAFLHGPDMVDSRPDYPLGLPLAWRLLALGASPGTLGYRLLHGAFALALLVLLRHGLLRLAGGEPLANALTAWGAALPLFWDSTFVGIAEMPLALWATAAAVLLAAGRGAAAEWGAGVALGFLPWIKDEGLPLALLLALLLAGFGPPEGGSAGERGRRRLRLLLPAAVGTVLALWVSATRLAPGVSFFAGSPLDRLAERLPRAWEVAHPMADVLVAGEGLGLWPAFLVAALLAAVRGMRRPLLLAGVVAFQLLLYMGVTYVVYLPPEAHVAAAFPRITTALTPLALLAVGWVVGGAEPPAARRGSVGDC